MKSSKNFKGSQGDWFEFNLPSGAAIVVLGLGDKEKFTSEILRRETASIFKNFKKRSEELALRPRHASDTYDGANCFRLCRGNLARQLQL